MPDWSATPPVKQTGGATARARQRRDARGDGVLHAGRNVGRRDAFGQQPDDLRFGKHHAHAADERRPGGCRGSGRPASTRSTPSRVRHHFQKPAGAGRAAVVHGKVPHAAAVFERMNLLSCPPISMMVRASGAR